MSNPRKILIGKKTLRINKAVINGKEIEIHIPYGRKGIVFRNLYDPTLSVTSGVVLITHHEKLIGTINYCSVLNVIKVNKQARLYNSGIINKTLKILVPSNAVLNLKLRVDQFNCTDEILNATQFPIEALLI